MREIKFVGNIKIGNDSRNYSYSTFECPECLEEVIGNIYENKDLIEVE